MERIILGRRNQNSWHGFQWTEAVPDGLNDPDDAVTLGACFEGDELVTYDLRALRNAAARWGDPYLADSD